MKSFRTPTTAALVVLAASAAVFAVADPYVLFDRFLERPRIPRLLSTVDFGLSMVTPDALQPLEGDFDGNGKPDLAMSGVYTLPGKTPDYFVLVVGDASSDRPTKLYLKQGPRPMYLFKAGSTGEGDPGNQAFSMAECINCSTGTDLTWDAEARSFRESPWKEGKRLQNLPPKNVDVDPAVADAALRVAGRLKDVQNFVGELQRRGSQLVTRVEAVDGGKNPAVARVLIYERSRAGDELYDAIDVDTARKRILRRGPVK